MELIQFNQVQTMEEYKEYMKQRSKIWYQANKEKKKKYQLERYYNSKKNSNK